MKSSTYQAATRRGSGVLLRDPDTLTRYEVSDWSPGTGQVFGRRILGTARYPWSWGAAESFRYGPYGELPRNLTDYKP